MTPLLKLTDFPARTYDKLRFGDTDRQGHVNNAVFTTLFETGRVSLMDEADRPLREPEFGFVIARLYVDYRGEIFWPGTVEIGTGVKAVGNTSITFIQALFQGEKCVATAESVIVQVDAKEHRPVPIGEKMRGQLEKLRLAVPEV
jgi:acyl-CoA thioester hydrolase